MNHGQENDPDYVSGLLRDALSDLVSAMTHMLTVLPDEATASRTFLESVIPSWDEAIESPNFPDDAALPLLIDLTQGVRHAITDIDQRLMRLEGF